MGRHMPLEIIQQIMLDAARFDDLRMLELSSCIDLSACMTALQADVKVQRQFRYSLCLVGKLIHEDAMQLLYRDPLFETADHVSDFVSLLTEATPNGNSSQGLPWARLIRRFAVPHEVAKELFLFEAQFQPFCRFLESFANSFQDFDVQHEPVKLGPFGAHSQICRLDWPLGYAQHLTGEQILYR